MISATSSAAGPSSPPVALATDAPDRASTLRAAAGAAARGLAELAIDAAASQLTQTTKASTSSKSTAKRSSSSKTSSAGYASKSSSSSSAKKAASSDPLAFLADPGLSIEDKLMRLLAHLNARYEQEMQQRMDALAGKTASAAPAKSGSSSSKKKGGIFGAIASVVTKVLPSAGGLVDLLKDKTFQAALKKLGGPVLAAGASALGLPALAPVLLKLGPTLASGAVDLAKALDAEAKSLASSASASSGASAAGKTELSSSQQQLELMKLQQLQEKQKEMFNLVSAIFRMQHDTRAGIIANIR